MTRAFTRVAFSPAVKAAQEALGAREFNARTEDREPARDTLNEDLIDYIQGADSAFLATASSEGWPYVQHRGGPPGFIRVLDERTLAFADYGGNSQYITVGNLSENDRAMLFIIDYERGRRLKLWGRATVVENDPMLLLRVLDRDYRARVERVIRFDIEAWDLNCRQHFPKLVRAGATA